MTPYTIAPGGFSPLQWIVVAMSPDVPAIQVFESEADAQIVVNRMNAAEEDKEA